MYIYIKIHNVSPDVMFDGSCTYQNIWKQVNYIPEAEQMGNFPEQKQSGQLLEDSFLCYVESDRHSLDRDICFVLKNFRHHTFLESGKKMCVVIYHRWS